MDFSAFSSAPFRSGVEMVVGDSLEALDISKFFDGRCAEEINLDELETKYAHDPAACLAFMTPDAFAFFLPSFMRIALEDYDRANAIPEVVIEYLLAMADGRDVLRRDVIRSSYSNAQLRAVGDFLREMSEKYWHQYPVDDAKQALSLYWAQF